MRLPPRTIQDRILGAVLFGAAAVAFFIVVLGELDWFVMPFAVVSGAITGAVYGPHVARSAAVRGWAVGGMGGGALVTAAAFVLTQTLFGISVAVAQGSAEGLESFALGLGLGGLFILPLALPFGAAAGLAMFAVEHARSPTAA